MSRNAKAYAMALIIVIWGYVLWTGNVFAQTPTVVLSPYKDYAITTTPPPRNADGTIKRDPKVIAAYRKLYPCPSTGLYTGACPDWALDHTRPIDCGGVDAVWNLTWMHNSIKSAKGPFTKDHYERRIYGGKGVSEGCP
jgi:hypothetical protein